MATIGQLVVEIAANSAHFRSELDRARGDFNRFTSGIKSGLQAIGVATSIAGLTALVKSAADAGAATREMATRMGISTRALQELQHAARETGTQTEALETGIRNLTRQMDEAAGGSAEAQEAFTRLGISWKTLANRDVLNVLDEIAEKINLRGPVEQGALALQLFGRSGTGMLPMLKEGAAGMSKLRQEAHQLGIVLTDDALKALDNTQDAFDRATHSLKVGFMKAVVEVSPALIGMANAVATLGAKMGELAKNTADWLREMARLPAVQQALPFLTRPTPGGSFGVSGSWDVAGKPGARPPSKKDLAEIEALLKEGEKGWVKVAEETFAATEAEQKYMEALKDLEKAAGEALIKLGDEGWVAMAEATFAATEAEQKYMEALQDLAKAQNDALIKEGVAGWVAVAEAAKAAHAAELKAIQEFEAARFERRFGALREGLATVFDGIRGAVSGTVQGILQGTQTIEQGLANMGRNIAASLIENVINRGLKIVEKALFDFITTASEQGLWSTILLLLAKTGISAGTGVATASVGGGGVSGGEIALQHGGIVMQPTRAIVGEAGPEAVIPLSHLGSGGTNIVIHNYSGSDVQHSEKAGSDGRRIHEFIITAVRQGAASGELESMFGGFGGRRVAMQR